MVPVTEQPVRHEVVDGVAWLTINRPETRNALNKAVRDGLFAGVHRFNAERIWAPVYSSQDAQEGPAAFRDKRAPAWKGC